MEIGVLKEILDGIHQIENNYNKSVIEQGENFNIFKILRMERKEVETHSRFIYNLISTNKSHGQEHLFFGLFLQYVLQLSDFDFEGLKTAREYRIVGDRRIDFYIESKSHLIAIEMKLDAGDQHHQLHDYYEWIKNKANGRKYELFYLNLHGHEASADSLGNLDSKNYRIITFDEHILDWLNECIKACCNKAVLREALKQYYTSIEEITGRRVKLTDEVAKKLLESQEAMKAAKLIADGAFKEAKKRIQSDFWRELQKQLKVEFEGIKFNFSDDEIEKKVKDYYNNRKASEIHLSFETNQNTSFCIRLFSAIHYGIRGSLKSDELLSMGDKAVAHDEGGWVVAFYGKEEEDRINFWDINDQVMSFVDSVKLGKSIEKIVTHLKNVEEEYLKLRDK